MSILSTARYVYRQWVSDGVPATGKHEPDKPEIIGLFGEVQAQLELAIAGSGANGGVVFAATRTALYALNPTIPVDSGGVLGVVYADSTAAYNGFYVHPTSGTGSTHWPKADFTLPGTVGDDIAALAAALDAVGDDLAEIDKGRSVRPLAITGTGDAIIGTSPSPIPALAAYELGQAFVFRATATNTTAPTLAVDGLAAQTILGPEGTNLAAGDLVVNRIYTLVRRSSTSFAITGGTIGTATSKTLAASVATQATAITAETEARKVSDIANIGTPYRPGDSLHLFGASPTGAPGSITPITSVKIVATDRGNVYRATGAETLSLIPAFPVEPGEIELVTYVVRRRVQEDPSGDGVRRAIRWLDNNHAALGAARIVTEVSPTVAEGRVKVQALISTVAGDDVGPIQRFTIPESAVFWRPYVQTFGASHETDIESIERRNVTDLVSSGLDVTAILAQLAAIESDVADLADGQAGQETRLAALEGSLGAIDSIPAITEIPSPDNLFAIRDRLGRTFSITLEGRVPSHDLGRGVVQEIPSDIWRSAVTDRAGRVIEGERHDGTYYRAGEASGGDADELATRFLVDTVGAPPNRYVVAVDPEGHDIRVSPPGLDAYAPAAVADGVIYAEAFDGVTTRRKSHLDFDHPLAESVAELMHIPVTGQSLSLGLTGPPREVEATSANIPGRTVMFTGGIRTLGNSMNGTSLDTPLALDLIKDLIPMAERLDIGGGETPWSRCARYVALSQGSTKALLPSCHGISGQVYANVKKGTIQWANMIRAVQRAKTMTQRLGLAYSVPALCLINGEADRDDALAVFQAKLEELVFDAQDMAAISGQADPVMLFLCQYSAWTDVAIATCEIPLAQLQASLDNPGEIFCVGPKYHLEHSPDGTHLLSPRSDSIHGHYYGRAISQTLNGDPWKPLYPVSIEWAGAEALVGFNVPEGTLAIDTTLVSNPGDYGVEYVQTGGSPPLIDTITTHGDGVSLVITMDGSPTGTGPGFGFGITGISGEPGGPTTGPRTNIRDTSTELTEFGGPMFNWLCHSIVRAS